MKGVKGTDPALGRLHPTLSDTNTARNTWRTIRQTRGTNASAMGTLKRQDIFKAISVIGLGEA